MNKQMGRDKIEIINNHLAIGEFISYKDYGDFINELADMLTVLGDKMLNFWYQQVDTVEEANSITPDGYYSVGEYQTGPTTLTMSYDLPQTMGVPEDTFENISDLINLTLSLVSNNREEAYIIEIKANMEDIFTPDNYIPISFISPYGTRTSRYQKEEMSLTLFESEENVTNQVPALRELMNILYDGYTTGKWLNSWSKYVYLNYKKVSRLLFLT